MWKTQGAVATLRYVHHLPHGRALPLGLDLAELDRIIASCDSFYRGGYRDWPTQWFKAGDQYLERGRKALAERPPRDRGADAASRRRSATTSPATCITTSAACCRRPGIRCCARLKSTGRRRRCSRRRRSRSRCLTTTRCCGRSCACRAGVERPPCVVMIGGANSNMINMHAVSDYYLDRGMATVGFDGPGQGEFRARTGRPLRVKDYDRALSAVADWAQNDTARRRQAARHLRPRHRRAAGHARGGPRQAIQGGGRASRRLPLRQLFRAGLRPHPGLAPAGDVQLRSAPKRWRRARGWCREELTLEHVAERIDFPILSVCSADDETMPTTRIRRPEGARQRAGRDRRVPGKGHGGPSRLSLPLEADWMSKQLAG